MDSDPRPHSLPASLRSNPWNTVSAVHVTAPPVQVTTPPVPVTAPQLPVTAPQVPVTAPPVPVTAQQVLHCPKTLGIKILLQKSTLYRT
jgi:hypothetical protein